MAKERKHNIGAALWVSDLCTEAACWYDSYMKWMSGYYTNTLENSLASSVGGRWVVGQMATFMIECLDLFCEMYLSTPCLQWEESKTYIATSEAAWMMLIVSVP